jgi:hypothetical protein
MKDPVSKANVHRHLGEPDLAGPLRPDTGWTGAIEYEAYYVHGPVYRRRDETGNKMFLGMTLGLGELCSFPVFMYDKTSGFFSDYTLYFFYRPNGSVRMSDSGRGKKTSADFRWR